MTTDAVSVVFGHTGGLGGALTNRLLAEGETVIGIARSPRAASHERLEFLPADLRIPGEVESIAQHLAAEKRRLQSVWYFAGALAAHKDAPPSWDDLSQLYAINAFAPIVIESQLMNRFAVDETLIVNTTSSSIHEHYGAFAGYASSKAALAQFTSHLRAELAGSNARVVEFCPSGFRSEMYLKMLGERLPRDEAIQMSPDDLVDLLWEVARLPSSVEVGEIRVNRKLPPSDSDSVGAPHRSS